MNYKIFEKTFEVNLLTDFFFDNPKQIIFYLNDSIYLAKEKLVIISGEFSNLGLPENSTIETLFEYVDEKSEICSIEGKSVFVDKIKNIINNSSDDIYFKLPITTNSTKWISVFLKKMKQGIYVGQIKNSSWDEINTDKLIQDSYKDSLTGLFNKNTCRLHFSHLNDECYIGFLDIDNFKEINDLYGHEAGDVLLKEFSYALMSICNQNIIFYRNGGDEFVFQASNITKAEILHIFKTIQHELSLIKYHNIKLTVSIGYLYVSKGLFNDGIEALKYADLAMYYAKQNHNGKIISLSEKDILNLKNSNSFDDMLTKLKSSRVKKTIIK